MAADGKRRSDDESDDNWDSWTAADKRLKAKSGWIAYKDEDGKKFDGNGTDDYGFAALSGGERYSSGEYMKPGNESVWWTSKENNGGSAYRMEMRQNVSFIGPTFKKEEHSVRCVSDDGVIVKAGAGGAFSLALNAGSGGSLSAVPKKDSYVAGERVTITAVPDSGHVFASWTGGRAADSVSLVTVITVMSDTAVAAKFRRIVYGALADARDGKVYRTVKIGRRTWMAENLNYKPEKGVSSCLNGKGANCEKFGRLYDWYTAMAVCPAGWYLPSFEEWDRLVVDIGGPDVAGRKLKAASGWVGEGGSRGKGTDDYGFAALPGGGEPMSRFENNNVFGAWWTETKYYGGIDAVSARVTLHKDIFNGFATEKSDRYSVRCVMDEGGSLTLNGLEGGTVSSEPRKTSFKAGEKVTITAVPKSGYEFAYWSGGIFADSASAASAIAVRGNMNITANFRVTPPGVPGTLTDARDGQKYRTTKIGRQTWMAQNLNYKADRSWCYRDSASYCKKYGRFYSWKTAESACPAGWRLPSREEWDVLAKAVGGNMDDEYENTVEWRDAGKALKTKTGWSGLRCCGDDEEANGTDDYGFSALPSGVNENLDACLDNGPEYCDGVFFNIHASAGWWTAESVGGEAYSRNVYDNSYNLSENFHDKEGYGLSVRCIVDGWNKQASAPKKRAVPAGGKPEIDMVLVKGGTFKMGGGDAVCKCQLKDSAHNVTLSDFYIGKYPVTQKQWSAVMGGNPSAGPVGDDYPVNNVSWEDIDEFIERLNAVTGKKYRLPTEAQWEYAARGGAVGKGYKYSGSDNPDDVAWHEGNSGGEAHPVGVKAPNELGIYDMTGNVWELLSDWWGGYGSGDQTDPAGPKNGVARAGRGCSWGRKPCRVYDRGYSPPGESSYDSGFRLALPP
ncbi:hypothetical protein R80B4_00906 [Fibrobacteres bacterium R8-0-B4]